MGGKGNFNDSCRLGSGIGDNFCSSVGSMRLHTFLGVSPFDLHVREGWYKTSTTCSLPIILGWELFGEVVAVGEHANFKEGDLVFAHPSVYHMVALITIYLA